MTFRKLIDIVEYGVGVVARNKKEANDPRYSMSITQDVKPGETARQAEKFGNKVDKNGLPPLLHKTAAKNSTPNKLMNLGLNESRGVTAREPGDQYVSVTDPTDIITIKNITVVAPKGKDSFGTHENLLKAIDSIIPPKDLRINDNVPTASAKAAVIAQVTDSQNKNQYWIRYITKIPATGVHGLWKTFKGYTLNTARSQSETIPIKPSNVIMDEKERSQAELATKVKTGVREKVAGTANEPLANVMDQAVNLAISGKVAPIPNAIVYSTVISKYGSEYLGPLALMSGKFTGGDISKAMQVLGIKTFVGSKVRFSLSTSQALWDSMIRTADGKEIQISTKMHKGGGAASSLSGIVKQITPDIEQAHPKSIQILRYLGEEESTVGIIKAALAYKIIDSKMASEILALPRNSKNLKDVKNPKLKTFIQSQGVNPGALQRPDYRIYYHALAAVANKVMETANADKDFSSALLKTLNNNSYLQLLAKTTESGDSITLDYYGKFPTEFSGFPVLNNKAFWATGQQGRMGFKLQAAKSAAPEPEDDATPAKKLSPLRAKRKPVPISAKEPKLNPNKKGAGREKRK